MTDPAKSTSMSEESSSKLKEPRRRKKGRKPRLTTASFLRPPYHNNATAIKEFNADSWFMDTSSESEEDSTSSGSEGEEAEPARKEDEKSPAKNGTTGASSTMGFFVIAVIFVSIGGGVAYKLGYLPSRFRYVEGVAAAPQ